MKKGLLLAVVLALLAGGGVWLLDQSNRQSPQPSNQQTQTADNQTLKPPADSQPGDYVEYSDSAVANAEGEIFLFFHAPWCSQCRSIESGIISDGVPEGVTVIKVDYDSNQKLRQKYGVTLQTTFVKVTKSGEFVSKFVAYDDPYFSSVVQNYINK
jgi:thiol-disulfide isomerase/thioredoxin